MLVRSALLLALVIAVAPAAGQPSFGPRTLDSLARTEHGRYAMQSALQRTWTDSLTRALRLPVAGFWPEIYFRGYDDVSEALGMPLLRDDTTNAGLEIRLWWQVEIGVPKDLFRLVKAGEQVRGEYIRYWPVRRWTDGDADTLVVERDEFVPWFEPPRCSRLIAHENVDACVTRFLEEPDWNRMWDELDSLGVWMLSDASHLPLDGFSIDGLTLVVELRNRHLYRAYRLKPDPEGLAEVAAAGAIGSLLTLVGIALPPTGRDSVLAGHLIDHRGRDGGETVFVPCGRTGRWRLFQGNAPEPELLPPRAFVRLNLLVGPLDKRWHHREGFERVAYVNEVVERRPARPDDCAAPPR